MSVNVRIQLPLSVNTERVIKVMGKCLGVDFHLKTFDDKPFNSSEASSKENSWHFSFNKKGETFIDAKSDERDVSFCHFNVKDCAGNSLSWLFFYETEDESYKLLSPGSSAIAVALGRRLVKFFGGEIQYTDYDDKSDMRCSDASSLFPTKKKSQSSDDRWYQFQNALLAQPLLTVKELEFGKKKASYWTDRDENFLSHLKIIEDRQKMDKVLPRSDLTKPTLRL